MTAAGDGLASSGPASTEALAGVQSDFGRLIAGNAVAVVYPQTASELATLVTRARAEGQTLSVRGAGLSQSGQSLADNGTAVVMSGWKRVLHVDHERKTVTCEPGVTWRELLAATLPLGLAPRVQPLNLDLTVGGTLSAGGLGSTSHRHGFAVSHVSSANVVLGTGELVRTGPHLERDVFDAVFGGVGRCGIIVEVELLLEAVPRGLNVVTLRYASMEALSRDLLTLATRDAAHHVGAICSSSVHGLFKSAQGSREPLRHWSFGVEIAMPGDDTGAVEREVLEGLQFEEILHRESDDPGSFFARYDVRFEAMRRTGAWQQAHPWFEALIVPEALPGVWEKLRALPVLLGDGHRITIVADHDRPTSVAFPGHGPAAMIAVLPMGVPEPLVPVALHALSALEAHIRGIGGRRYISGWLARTGEFRWPDHYDRAFERVVELKRRFDPGGVFQSKLAPLDT